MGKRYANCIRWGHDTELIVSSVGPLSDYYSEMLCTILYNNRIMLVKWEYPSRIRNKRSIVLRNVHEDCYAHRAIFRFRECQAQRDSQNYAFVHGTSDYETNKIDFWGPRSSAKNPTGLIYALALTRYIYGSCLYKLGPNFPQNKASSSMSI